ncbi:hypothetical protein HAX54_044550 [Datura stramonium]|uniref:Uncharacterized protein n=1 Tax=Datura stramonium TaxID=4076 RepID=A0ABS8WGW8_DATST|nr:hypothetical protein [Datura stramonium]
MGPVYSSVDCDRESPSTSVTNVTYPQPLLVAYSLSGLLINMGEEIADEWRYFLAKSVTCVPFPTLITLLCKKAKVHRDAKHVMVACDVPFDPMRVKGALVRGRKKRKAASNDEGSVVGPSEPVGSFELIKTEMASMRELLGGFLKPPLGDRPSSAAAADPDRCMK